MVARPGSASALSEFLKGGADRADEPFASLDKLGAVLVAPGEAGLPFAVAMERAGLSRSEFFSALSMGTSTGVVETVEVKGERRVRLTEDGRSLY